MTTKENLEREREGGGKGIELILRGRFIFNAAQGNLKIASDYRNIFKDLRFPLGNVIPREL